MGCDPKCFVDSALKLRNPYLHELGLRGFGWIQRSGDAETRSPCSEPQNFIAGWPEQDKILDVNMGFSNNWGAPLLAVPK